MSLGFRFSVGTFVKLDFGGPQADLEVCSLASMKVNLPRVNLSPDCHLSSKIRILVLFVQRSIECSKKP